MHINLTPELQALVARKVSSGLYNNQSEVVREALRLMAHRDEEQVHRRESLRRSLRVGLDQAERGELTDAAAVIAELRADHPE
ncbi:MAG: type II toxin-antitoxin system ParD family antitoxin [Planctomycetota bacterium]